MLPGAAVITTLQKPRGRALQGRTVLTLPAPHRPAGAGGAPESWRRGAQLPQKARGLSSGHDTARGMAWVTDGLGEGWCGQRPGYWGWGWELGPAWSGGARNPGPRAVRAIARLFGEKVTSGPT